MGLSRLTVVGASRIEMQKSLFTTEQTVAILHDHVTGAD